ncbi:hypothetical protein AB0F68_20640 [Micromonospora sp. NPDC023966]
MVPGVVMAVACPVLTVAPLLVSRRPAAEPVASTPAGPAVSGS